MKQATIQINGLSGVGDIFCDIYIAVNIANALKQDGCIPDLKFYYLCLRIEFTFFEVVDTV